jgi:hypothetical protein
VTRTYSLALSLLLFAAPLPLAAQAEWRIEGFALTELGFSGTLLFRNGQSPFDSPIRGIGALRISLTPSTPRCANPDECLFVGGHVTRTGNIDTRTTAFAGGSTLTFNTGVWSEDSCVGKGCWSRLYDAPFGSGALGCPAPFGAPGGAAFYAGRTCAADGFDGWFALPFEWRSFAALPTGFVWKESDLLPEFFYRDAGTLNGFLVPEPASAMMLAGGLLMLAAWRRRHRGSPS